MIDLTAILRHDRIAFELSGGKDSTAALYYLRQWWDRMTVYWLNTGDPVPEVREHVYRIRDEVPHFREVAGRRDEVWRAGGWPSDLVPVNFLPFGLVVKGDRRSPPIQGRYDCCYQSLMVPLQAAVAADGNTLIVRGQKRSDPMKGPHQSGEIVDGFEVLYPIEDWDDDQVYTYLRENSIALPSSYDLINVSPDCLNCTAWWGERRSVFLRERHPEAFEKYQVRMRYIRNAIRAEMAALDKEVM